jgi:hypothetical protein
LASSRVSKNTPDIVDVAEALTAFEDLNKCSISLCMRSVPKGALPLLELELTAWQKEGERSEASRLASVKLRAGYSDRRPMDALIFQLMYALDAEFARIEMQGK